MLRTHRTVDFGDRINLDLKFRHAAGLGAETVRRNQEHFSRICWSQYREIVEANQALARLKTARHLSDSLSIRHVAALPPSVVAALSESVHDMAVLNNGRSTAELYAGAGVPASFTSRALRRVASKRTLRVDSRAALAGGALGLSHQCRLRRENDQRRTASRTRLRFTCPCLILKCELQRRARSPSSSERMRF